MNYKNALIALSSAIVLLLAGCATGPVYQSEWKSNPATSKVSNEYYTAEITPVCTNELYFSKCTSFVLVIHNKSKNNIELDWNKTLYIADGQSSGGFMFEGIVYRDRNNPKPPDVIFENGKLTKTVWPNNLVSFETGKYGGWMHETLGEGERGIYLTALINGKPVSEKLVVRLSQHEECVARCGK